jgi:hypothetical protein
MSDEWLVMSNANAQVLLPVKSESGNIPEYI